MVVTGSQGTAACCCLTPSHIAARVMRMLHAYWPDPGGLGYRAGDGGGGQQPGAVQDGTGAHAGKTQPAPGEGTLAPNPH
ncbi:hypothetical protein HaLaN_04394 [Haematococcus lacustris]|uniref:Uncharacterized protein n=1 Tax=Haematococcus lacustris TaxID=44745 RepID=A0A699YJ56_HAELA|nr:hypothetical protein HaLaN_04394 [Haematococcus lacustris]